VGFTMFVTVLCMQLTLVLQGPILKTIDGGSLPYAMSIADLVQGMFGAATCLISFGVVVGLVSPVQLTIMCIIEIPLWLLNVWIGTTKLSPAALDVGGSIFVHMFGAYFGVAMSLAMYQAKSGRNTLNGSSYNSELFSFIGVVFLLVLWPSFNAAVASPSLRYRVIINTVLSISGSTFASFAVSMIVGRTRSLSVGGEDIQNGVLAGGVAAGAVADMDIGSPGVIIVLGFVAGTVTVLGYQKISGALSRTINLHDTCGVHNLHGMPSIIGALVSVLVCGVAQGMEHGNFHIKDGAARSQILAIVITLCISVGGGFVTGRLMSNFPQHSEAYFNDAQWWEVDDVFSIMRSDKHQGLDALMNSMAEPGNQPRGAQAIRDEYLDTSQPTSPELHLQQVLEKADMQKQIAARDRGLREACTAQQILEASSVDEASTTSRAWSGQHLASTDNGPVSGSEPMVVDTRVVYA